MSGWSTSISRWDRVATRAVPEHSQSRNRSAHDVVGIFPDQTALIWLIRTVRAENARSRDPAAPGRCQSGCAFMTLAGRISVLHSEGVASQLSTLCVLSGARSRGRIR